jgi:hypothetical protein
MATEYRLVGSHPEDLADGRTIAVDDVVSLSTEEAGHPHNKRLIDDGVLLSLDGSSESEVLTGKALDDRAKELGIEGRSNLGADELRKAVAEAEAQASNDDGGN